MPLSKRSRRTLPIADGFVPGQELVFYSGLEPPSSSYMQCLLRAQELVNCGLKHVPHAKPETLHRKILAGNVNLEELLTKPERLTLDVDTAPAIADVAPGADDGDPEGGEDKDEDKDEEEELQNALETIFLEDGIGDPGGAAEGGAAEGGDVPGAGPERAPPTPLLHWDRDYILDEMEKKVLDANGHLKRGYLGPFRITATKATSDSPGGYQAECPFHAKSHVTGCKKQIGFLMDSLVARRPYRNR